MNPLSFQQAKSANSHQLTIRDPTQQLIIMHRIQKIKIPISLTHISKSNPPFISLFVLNIEFSNSYATRRCSRINIHCHSRFQPTACTFSSILALYCPETFLLCMHWRGLCDNDCNVMNHVIRTVVPVGDRFSALI